MKKIVFFSILTLLVISEATIGQKRPKKSKEKAAVETLKEDSIDPICKMKVKKGSAITHTHNGQQYGFCNPGCKETFIKNPEKFAKK